MTSRSPHAGCDDAAPHPASWSRGDRARWRAGRRSRLGSQTAPSGQPARSPTVRRPPAGKPVRPPRRRRPRSRAAPPAGRAGSHLDIARQLAPAGEAGLSLRELAADGFAASSHRPEVLAVGEAGTVYLCHPFLVHAAQPHRGRNPRFLAQPPLLPREPISLDRSSGDYSPVEQAILRAIA